MTEMSKMGNVDFVPHPALGAWSAAGSLAVDETQRCANRPKNGHDQDLISCLKLCLLRIR